MKKYFFGNWKTYQSLLMVKKFIKNFNADEAWHQGLKDRFVGIAASYEHLYFLQKNLKKNSCLLGAQDCSQFAQGPYTGQVSIQSLQEMNMTFCIVGHSETRIYLGQSYEQVALKFKALVAAKISPILCIGETLLEKEEGKTLQVLFDQLEIILGFLQAYSDGLKIFIAYEPVYAIGTGIIPSQKDLQEVFYFLKKLREQVSIAKNIALLYGGSVSSLTISDLQNIDGISGFLIGKSSIDFQELKKIVES